MIPIRITIADIELQAELNETKTALTIAQKLPITFTGNYWGDEIYGTIPVRCEEENPVEVIEEPGTLGYWRIGRAFCIFWGATPVSRDGEIRPASPVTVIGKVTAGLEELIVKRPQRLIIRIEAE